MYELGGGVLLGTMPRERASLRDAHPSQERRADKSRTKWMIAKRRGGGEQVPLERLLLETDSPDGLPKLASPEMGGQLKRCCPVDANGGTSNHPSNLR